MIFGPVGYGAVMGESHLNSFGADENRSGHPAPAKEFLLFDMESDVIELDARELEPPQPLMRTLEVIATLPEGKRLRLHTQWRPALLYAELEKRGFSGESVEQADGSYITDIRRS